MSTYTGFDKTAAKALSHELNVLLSAWAAERNLTVRINGGRFGSMSYAPRIEFVPRTTAEGKDPAQVTFEHFAPIFGLEPGDFQATFYQNSRQWTITGLRLNSKAKPIILRRDDGKEFVSTADGVRRALGRVPKFSVVGGAR